jgi:hypothetical protein
MNRAELRDDAVRYITPRSLLIFGLIAAVVFAYCEGKRSERAAVQSSRYERQRTIIVDSASAVHDSEKAHTAELHDLEFDVKQARATHAKIAARLVPASARGARLGFARAPGRYGGARIRDDARGAE